ncbi:MAG TPA: hypothetical protein VLW85_06005 [Myxococcales bacterium]|nr:hypothetical protein [Myxococcales bacterium]
MRRHLAAALCLALAACGGKHAAEGGGGFDGGTSAYALSLVGSANMVVHPSDKRTLQVILTQDQVGPVANAAVHFEFQDGDQKGAKIDAADVTTDANGVGTVHYQAGTSSAGNPTYKLVASAPNFGSDPVAFSFEVRPIQRLLQIVGSSTTHVNSDDTSATVIVGVTSSATLSVKELDADTGAAIAGDKLQFNIAPGETASHWGSGPGVTGNKFEGTTGPGGVVQGFLVASPNPETSFPITAQSENGSATVTFNVSVQSGAGQGCTTNAQCGPGMVCIGNPPTCQPGGGGSGGCDTGSDNPCPAGYLCVDDVCVPPTGSQCDPNAPNCPSGQCCNTSDTCVPDCASPCNPGTHCVPNPASCGNGSCVADTATPDLTGVWLTKHDYNIRQALPTAVQDLADAFRLLDQAIKGKLTIPGLPGWLNAIVNSIVSSLLQQYLPDWLQTVVSIGDDLFTVLSNVRSAGSMHLVKNPDLTHLKGNEIWTSLIFYWLPLCGDNIGGDYSNPPPCAEIDIATTDSDTPGENGDCKGQSLPSITIQVSQFFSTLAGSGTGPYTLNVDQRQVSMKMGKVILVLIDLIISYVTPYHCIDEITDCQPGPGNCPLVDCYGFGQDVENSTGGLVPADLAEAACDAAVTAAGQVLTQLLANVWSPNVDTLDFNGHAAVSGSADDSACDDGVQPGTCGGQLGNDNWDLYLNGSSDANRNNRDGFWSGQFFFKTINNLPGAWEAKRPQ